MPSWWPFRRRSAEPAPALPPPQPDPRPRADAWRDTREDAWRDPWSGMGSDERDPRGSSVFIADLVSALQAAEMVRGDGIAGKLVEDVVLEAFRIGFDINIKERDKTRGRRGQDATEDVRPADRLKADVLAMWSPNGLDALAKVAEADTLERQDGGAAILLGLNDMRTKPSEPPAATAKLEWLKVIHPSNLYPERYYSDPFQGKQGEVELWRLTPIVRAGAGGGLASAAPINVHESRLIMMRGMRVAGSDAMNTRYEYPEFGDSVLTRAKAAVRRFYSALDSIELTARRNGEPYWKLTKLADLIAKDRGKLFRQRLAAKELARSTLRLHVVDKEDDFGMAAAPLTGIKEVVETFKDELAAVTGMPRTRLFGETPAGIGNTGQGPQQVWFDWVAAHAKKKDVPALTKITARWMAGQGGEPLEWEIVPRDGWQMSEKERAEIDELDARTDATLANAGIITGRDVRAREKWQLRYQLDQVEDAGDTNIPDDVRDPGGDLGGAPGGAELQKTALNGAQVASLTDVVRAVANGEIPWESGVAIAMVAFPESVPDRTAAEQLMGPKDFKAPPKAPPPAPFGGPPVPPKQGGPAPAPTPVVEEKTPDGASKPPPTPKGAPPPDDDDDEEPAS